MNLWPYLTGLDNFETKGISERICQYDVRDSCSKNITRSIKTADKVHFGLTKGCHCYEIFYFKKIIALANLSKVCFITLIWLFLTFLCKSFCNFLSKEYVYSPLCVYNVSLYQYNTPMSLFAIYLSINGTKHLHIYCLTTIYTCYIELKVTTLKKAVCDDQFGIRRYTDY